MQLKPGTRIQGIRPELVLGLCIANTVFTSRNYILTIQSIHHVGCAADLRVSHILPEQRLQLRDALDIALGPEFAVKLLPTHLNIEFRPAQT
jgi:hypothetical protein